ncbi:MAG TPA: AarF/ABC1/UbiB kinase family protein [Bacteroidetes bacterium]|nr:AarF/ABC1/UbiB kinase family protein [Bacteroidota bacterium]
MAHRSFPPDPHDPTEPSDLHAGDGAEPREAEVEPVPFSETAPEAVPPAPLPEPPAAENPSEPTASAEPPEDADGETLTEEALERAERDPALAPTPASVRAQPAPGPVRSRLLADRAGKVNQAESERAIIRELRKLSQRRRQPETEDAGTLVAREAGFEVMEVGPPPSLVRRYFTILRHAIGLVYGSAVAVARDREQFAWVKGFPLFLIKVARFFVTPFVKRDLRQLPLEVQLRRRLELLGPTYIKLGQVLALREDILPEFITEELKNLLDKLPVMPFPEYLDRVSKGLGQPADELFEWIDPKPLGSASIGQIHRARTRPTEERGAEDVILKVVKPHIYVVLKRDARLLGFFGRFLQIFFARYQPKRILDEFAEYTLREVDLRREADNAEQLALNFADMPQIRFPRIYRDLSSRLVMTMEMFKGLRPDVPEARALPYEVRREIVDLGARSIIRMLYQDGFFHADLHPGNLFLLDTEPDPRTGEYEPKIGFIDLGMVGYFDGELRRTLMYYYFSLVTGDAENAARYLTSVAEAGPKSDTAGFQRAVAEICRRFYRASKYGDFSIAQLIMESVSLGGTYRMYFPIELVLMTKALVTFEGVGRALIPGLDVADVSQKHVSRLFRRQFNPVTLIKESFRNAPELVDLLIKSPSLAAEGMRFIESRIRQPNSSPLQGLRSALLAGSLFVSGTLAATLDVLDTGVNVWWLWVPLFLLAGGLALKKS